MIKERIDKVVEYIDSKRKIIITASLSLLGAILVFIIIVMSANNFSVSDEVNRLTSYIEKRQLSESVSYYEKVKKESSSFKMARFDKNISKKINKILLNYGDKYIKGEIGKDYYISLINIINELSGIVIDGENILNQATRVKDLYLNEKIDYDVAIGYMSSISNLNIAKSDIDTYTANLKLVEESRELYRDAVKKQEKKLYKEAIEQYDKVLEDDKKYYDLAIKNKEECINKMYNYYIEKAEDYYALGNYEESLNLINYLKEHYTEDEKLDSLSNKYAKSLEKYNMTNDDILNLIASKSGINKLELNLNIYQQMINVEKYYYVEVYQNETLINEILVNPKNKKIYSYLDTTKAYAGDYADGYWRVVENSVIEIAMDKSTAKRIIGENLSKNKIEFKNINVIDKKKALSYLNDKSQQNLENFLGNSYDIYYYAVPNKGILSLFSKKEVYMINPYNQKVYSISGDEIVSFE